MYANYTEYRAIISIIRVHSRNSRLNSEGCGPPWTAAENPHGWAAGMPPGVQVWRFAYAKRHKQKWQEAIFAPRKG
jgi:hypothetical protein